MADNNAISCLQDIEDFAKTILPKAVFDNYSSGANQMTTLKDNRKAFQRYKLLPRMLVNVSACNIKTRILGQEISMPLGISPTALQKLAHPDGECASAKAAEEAGIIFILSSISTSR